MPLATALAIQAATASEAAQPLAGDPVLCIENEDSILLGLRSLLGRWGCQVWTARSREECAALLDQGVVPRLLIVDYHLSDADTGPDVAEWIRQVLRQDIPGIVISADGRPECLAKVREARLDFLPKPVKPASLRALLSRQLALSG